MTLLLSDVAFTNAGSYTVVVTNLYGSVTSAVAVVSVGTPPVITTQPSSETNLTGSLAFFTVAVSGPGPFSYQWQFNGTNLPNDIISTVAGKGEKGYAGDGGPATNALLDNPGSPAFDAHGNLHFVDTWNHRVRRVDLSGNITTVAGNGSGTYAGDGGAATNASLYYPAGAAFDSSGRLYIADQINGRVRRVATNGIIITVAGGSTSVYTGDGGPATNASLGYPTGVTVDALGNLYIADETNPTSATGVAI